MDLFRISAPSVISDGGGGVPVRGRHRREFFFLRANSYTISYEYDARKNTEQLRRDGRHGHEGARGGGSGEFWGVYGGGKGPATWADQGVKKDQYTCTESE